MGDNRVPRKRTRYSALKSQLRAHTIPKQVTYSCYIGLPNKSTQVQMSSYQKTDVNLIKVDERNQNMLTGSANQRPALAPAVPSSVLFRDLQPQVV